MRESLLARHRVRYAMLATNVRPSVRHLSRIVISRKLNNIDL